MIAPLIAELLHQSQLTSAERAFILDQFHNLEPYEELAWLKFLWAEPNFFRQLGLQVRKLGNAVLFNDKNYLNQLRQQAIADYFALDV